MLIQHPALQGATEHYADMSTHKPLRVVAQLRPGAHVVSYDPVNLDSLLCWAVMHEATQGAGLPNTPEPYALPAPLSVLWRNDDYLPLYAAQSFYPVGESASDVHYYHKRAPEGQFSKPNAKDGSMRIETIKGRWMERRIPVPTFTTLEIEAFCVGDANENARLLHLVSHVGKRRATGMGEVAAWRVSCASEFKVWRDWPEGRKLVKSLPFAAASALKLECAGEVSLCGWTPPQWLPSAQLAGWREGAAVVS